MYTWSASKEKQLVAKDSEQCLSWTYYELDIRMILQIHKGHEAYLRIRYLNCSHGLQAYTGY
jgi:hypothetical protein